jgi:ABC-type Fe3+/spermidine/putrescine transport system ATPase subunit
MLELRDLQKRLGQWSLPGLDLVLEPGEYFVLLGPSGVGKSVTLEIIAGLRPPDHGQILWKGEDLTAWSPEDRPFAIVYQDCALFPHLTVRRNIAYGPKVSGVAPAEVGRRVDSLAELLRISELLDRDVGSLSGGEEQRVALARALATRPELLLLDEPLSALDASIREYLRGELARLHTESGATFLHVTHAKEEARHLADRVGVMLGGRLVQVATPRELFREPTNLEVSEFLGLRNLLPLRCIEAGRGEVGGVSLVGASLKPGSDHLWIRPEEVTLSREAPTDPAAGSASTQANLLEGRILRVEDADTLRRIHVVCGDGDLALEVLVTDARFEALGLCTGDSVQISFGDAALHCL